MRRGRRTAIRPAPQHERHRTLATALALTAAAVLVFAVCVAVAAGRTRLAEVRLAIPVGCSPGAAANCPALVRALRTVAAAEPRTPADGSLLATALDGLVRPPPSTPETRLRALSGAVALGLSDRAGEMRLQVASERGSDAVRLAEAIADGLVAETIAGLAADAPAMITGSLGGPPDEARLAAARLRSAELGIAYARAKRLSPNKADPSDTPMLVALRRALVGLDRPGASRDETLLEAQRSSAQRQIRAEIQRIVAARRVDFELARDAEAALEARRGAEPQARPRRLDAARLLEQAPHRSRQELAAAGAGVAGGCLLVGLLRFGPRRRRDGPTFADDATMAASFVAIPTSRWQESAWP